MSDFLNSGLKELWIQYGSGSSQCFIPIHTLHQNLDKSIRVSPLKAHILIGTDVTSKVGTKPSALKKIKEFSLMNFCDENVPGEGFSDVERYLVNVLQRNSTCRTFDQLRYKL